MSARCFKATYCICIFSCSLDSLGEGSIVPILKTHPEIARKGLELKRLANEICAVVAGRHIHPISLFPGGVVHLPTASAA